ncbi:MAG: hypothetical protein Q7S27_04770 [Nanoarchaeota archaeon]|nr:hypothetical protein [Nanoarchaeota archaeon]
MWTYHKEVKREFDVTKVNRDFIIFESDTSSFDFCSANFKNNYFGKQIYSSQLQIFNVNKNHPVELRSTSHQNVRLRVLGDERLPAQLALDKEVYRCSTLVLMPYKIEEVPAVEEEKARIYSIEKGFARIGQSERLDSSLLFVPHGDIIESEISKYCFMPPSQVWSHVHKWLLNRHVVYSKADIFNNKEEGHFEIPIDGVRKVSKDIVQTLEREYDIKLIFDN